MWKFPGQGSNLRHSSNSSQDSDNAGCLTRWATRALQYLFVKIKPCFYKYVQLYAIASTCCKIPCVTYARFSGSLSQRCNPGLPPHLRAAVTCCVHSSHGPGWECPPDICSAVNLCIRGHMQSFFFFLVNFFTFLITISNKIKLKFPHFTPVAQSLPLVCILITISYNWALLLLLLLSFLSFVLFRAAPKVYGGSQARSLIRAIAACLCHSHSNARSEPCLQTTPQLMATPDP